jgi:hypothetical protein
MSDKKPPQCRIGVSRRNASNVEDPASQFIHINISEQSRDGGSWCVGGVVIHEGNLDQLIDALVRFNLERRYSVPAGFPAQSRTQRYVNEIVELDRDCELGHVGERARVVDITRASPALATMTLCFFDRTLDSRVNTGADYRFLSRVCFHDGQPDCNCCSCAPIHGCSCASCLGIKTAPGKGESEHDQCDRATGDLGRPIAQTIERDEYAMVWVLAGATLADTARKARMFFGASAAAPVKIFKQCPETADERSKYKPTAVLVGVGVPEVRNNREPGVTAGARRLTTETRR